MCVSAYPWGTGLDFPANCSDSGQGVYFRGFGFNASGSTQHVAYAFPFTNDYGVCKETYAEIYDDATNDLLGTMRYVHTERTRDGRMLMYVASNGYKNQYPIAEMTTADKTNCPGWENGYWPIHLHDASADGASTFRLRGVADCGGSDRYPCAPGSSSPYNPQDWKNDWARALCSTNDTDCDDFTNSAEQYLGTDPADACPDNTSDDAWPLDMNKDKLLNLTGDVAKYVGKISCSLSSPACRRLDLNADGVVNLTRDVGMYTGRLGQTCCY
jgi:hypothetical protein